MNLDPDALLVRLRDGDALHQQAAERIERLHERLVAVEAELAATRGTLEDIRAPLPWKLGRTDEPPTTPR